MTKPYYASLWERSKPLWIADSKFPGSALLSGHVTDNYPLVHMEYFEREGEGSVWSDDYLVSGKKMEKGKEKEKEKEKGGELAST